MEERLFSDDTTLENVEEIINKYMEDGLLNFDNDKLIEKWNYLSVINLEDDDVKEKLLDMIKYIDEVIDVKENKINLILTLIYLLIKEKINIKDMNDNSLFLIVDYASKIGTDDIGNILNVITNQDLLYEVRLKTLDVEIRVLLLDYLVKHYSNVSDMIEFIRHNEYYEMLDIIRS